MSALSTAFQERVNHTGQDVHSEANYTRGNHNYNFNRTGGIFSWYDPNYWSIKYATDSQGLYLQLPTSL